MVQYCLIFLFIPAELLETNKIILLVNTFKAAPVVTPTIEAFAPRKTPLPLLSSLYRYNIRLIASNERRRHSTIAKYTRWSLF